MMKRNFEAMAGSEMNQDVDLGRVMDLGGMMVDKKPAKRNPAPAPSFQGFEAPAVTPRPAPEALVNPPSAKPSFSNLGSISKPKVSNRRHLGSTVKNMIAGVALVGISVWAVKFFEEEDGDSE